MEIVYTGNPAAPGVVTPELETSDLDTNRATGEQAGQLSAQVPAFDLLAEVFVDGRTKVDARCFLHLNPSHPHYCSSGVVLKGRPVLVGIDHSDTSDQYTIHDWVFTDFGIEALPEQMTVKDTKEFNSEHDHITRKIKIVFTKVVLGKHSSSVSASLDLNDQAHRSSPSGEAVGNAPTHTVK